jgi:hypothetical protein
MLGNDGVNGIDYLGLYNPEVRDPNNQPGFDDDPDDFPSLTLKGTGSISGGFSIVVYTATYMRLSGSLSLEHGECCDSSGELKEYQKISGTITGTVYTGTPTNLGGTWGGDVSLAATFLQDCPTKKTSLSATFTVFATVTTPGGGGGGPSCSTSYDYSSQQWSTRTCGLQWGTGSSDQGFGVEVGFSGSIQADFVDVF